MKIKNIILDMGKVLLDFDPDYSLNELCENEEAKPIIKKEYFEADEWIESDMGLITPKERLEKVKLRVPHEFHTDLERVAENWDICMTPIDGARDFCRYAKENGYRVFVLSNASCEFYSYFTKYYELDFFDGIVVSADLHLMKPDARIYNYLLEKFSLCAEECLFIDDRKENVEGAKAVGINAVLFENNYEEIKLKYKRVEVAPTDSA